MTTTTILLLPTGRALGRWAQFCTTGNGIRAKNGTTFLIPEGSGCNFSSRNHITHANGGWILHFFHLFLGPVLHFASEEFHSHRGDDDLLLSQVWVWYGQKKNMPRFGMTLWTEKICRSVYMGFPPREKNDNNKNPFKFGFKNFDTVQKILCFLTQSCSLDFSDFKQNMCKSFYFFWLTLRI